MFKYIKTSFFALCLSLSMTMVHADEKVKASTTPEQEAQVLALKNAMQREIWTIILTDTFELQQEELKDGIIFKEYGKDNVAKYQEWMTEICVEEKTPSCPEAFFTKKTNITVAAMYPNGKMYLNVNNLPSADSKDQVKLGSLFPEVAKGLTDDEIYFTIAHEMGHFVLQHSLKNTEFMADTIVENGFMVADMEKMVGAAFMLPGMKEYHHQVEDQADQFAVKYMKKRNIKIDCLKMFAKMVGDEKLSTEQHAGAEERCNKIDGK